MQLTIVNIDTRVGFLKCFWLQATFSWVLCFITTVVASRGKLRFGESSLFLWAKPTHKSIAGSWDFIVLYLCGGFSMGVPNGITTDFSPTDVGAEVRKYGLCNKTDGRKTGLTKQIGQSGSSSPGLWCKEQEVLLHSLQMYHNSAEERGDPTIPTAEEVSTFVNTDRKSHTHFVLKIK